MTLLREWETTTEELARKNGAPYGWVRCGAVKATIGRTPLGYPTGRAIVQMPSGELKEIDEQSAIDGAIDAQCHADVETLRVYGGIVRDVFGRDVDVFAPRRPVRVSLTPTSDALIGRCTEREYVLIDQYGAVIDCYVHGRDRPDEALRRVRTNWDAQIHRAKK